MSLFRCALPLLRFGFIALASRGTTGLRPSHGSCKTREAQSPRNSLDIYAYVKLIQKKPRESSSMFRFHSTTHRTLSSAIMQGVMSCVVKKKSARGINPLALFMIYFFGIWFSILLMPMMCYLVMPLAIVSTRFKVKPFIIWAMAAGSILEATSLPSFFG